jgi:hypothetical protein
MQNHLHRIHRIHRTRRAAAPVLTSMVTAVTAVTAAVTMAYLLAGALAGGGDRQLRRRITDRRDRGALSLEQAIVTAVLSAAAIALGVVIVNAVVSHQSQIR